MGSPKTPWVEYAGTGPPHWGTGKNPGENVNMGQGHITAQEPMERFRIRWGAIPQDDAFSILWGRGPPSRNRGEIPGAGAALRN